MLEFKCAVLILFWMIFVNEQVYAIAEDQKYWKFLGENDIQNALNKQINTNVAKNVILFVGDGMGLTTVTASRIYGKKEQGYLAFESFPHVGLLKTYCLDKMVPDSSCTATALFSGVKSNFKTAGVDGSVEMNDCEASLKKEAHLASVLSWAQEAGKSTGFVTTTRVTHHTPSALYSHIANRNWECDDTIPLASKKCSDIAKQLIENVPGKNINVIMGGGRQSLVSDVQGSEADPIDTWACYSRDGRNLIEDWKRDKIKSGFSHEVITNNEELNKLNPKTDQVLGIFANGHLKMNHQRERGPKGMPSLTNMTEKAIEILRKNDKGFFLMVEGGLIDYGHHRGHARQALDETLEFSNAIEKALAVTRNVASETLIIVTSDHSHSLVFAGYANRSASILDVAQKSEIDAVKYTSLLYGTGGPNNFQFTSKNNVVERRNPVLDDTQSFDYSQQSAIVTDEATHSGTDVSVYAIGPMSHLIHSVHEQTYVAYVIAYAAKIGPYKNSCLRIYLSTNLTLILIVVNYLFLF